MELLFLLAGALTFAGGCAFGYAVGVKMRMPEMPPRVPTYGSVAVLDKAVWPEWESPDDEA